MAFFRLQFPLYQQIITTAADLEHIDSKGLQQIMLQHVALTG
jgi:hypothetical protein